MLELWRCNQAKIVEFSVRIEDGLLCGLQRIALGRLFCVCCCIHSVKKFRHEMILTFGDSYTYALMCFICIFRRPIRLSAIVNRRQKGLILLWHFPSNAHDRKLLQKFNAHYFTKHSNSIFASLYDRPIFLNVYDSNGQPSFRCSFGFHRHRRIIPLEKYIEMGFSC